MDSHLLLPPPRPSDYADSLRSSITDSSSNVIGPQLAAKLWLKEKQCWVCDTPRGMGSGKARLYGCKFCLHAVCQSCSPARSFHAITHKAERMCSLCLESEKGEEAAQLAVEEKCKENLELHAELKKSRERLTALSETKEMQVEDFCAQILRAFPLITPPTAASQFAQTEVKTEEKETSAKAEAVEVAVQQKVEVRDCEMQASRPPTSEETVQCQPQMTDAQVRTETIAAEETSAQTEQLHLSSSDTQTIEQASASIETQCEYRANPSFGFQCLICEGVEAECQAEGPVMTDKQSQNDQWAEPEKSIQTDTSEGWRDESVNVSPQYSECANQTEALRLAHACEQTDVMTVIEGGFQTVPWSGVDVEIQAGDQELPLATQMEWEGVHTSAQTEGTQHSDAFTQADLCSCIPLAIDQSDTIPTESAQSAKDPHSPAEQMPSSPLHTDAECQCRAEAQLQLYTISTSVFVRAPIVCSIETFSVEICGSPKQVPATLSVDDISLRKTQVSAKSSFPETGEMEISKPTIKRKAKQASPFHAFEGVDSPRTAVVSSFSESVVVKANEAQTDVTSEDVAAAFADMEEITSRNEALEREVEELQRLLQSNKVTSGKTEKLESLSPEEHERISLQHAENQTIQTLLGRLKSCEHELHHYRINGSSRSVRTSVRGPAQSSCKCVVF